MQREVKGGSGANTESCHPHEFVQFGMSNVLLLVGLAVQQYELGSKGPSKAICSTAARASEEQAKKNKS